MAGFTIRDVGALCDVERDLPNFTAVAGIELVATTIADQRQVDRLAERPVERRSVLGRVAEIAVPAESLLSKSIAHESGDLAVHHAAETEQLGSRRPPARHPCPGSATGITSLIDCCRRRL
jgi:hypothetical protein